MRTKFKSLTNGLRLLLLATTFLGVATLAAFTFSPRWIDEIDQRTVTRYEARLQSRYDKGLALLKGDDADLGAQELETLLESLSHVKKLDRHANLKRKSLRALTKHYTQSNQADKALPWYHKWVSYDDRDLIAQMDYLRLLSKNPQTRPEADDLLNQLLQKAPEVWFISAKHIENLLGNNEHAEAMLAYHHWSSAIYHVINARWGMYWDTGSGFNEREKSSLEPTWHDRRKVELRAQLPPKTNGLRIDLPPWIPLALKDPLIFIGDGADQIRIELRQMRFRRNQMKQIGGSLVADGRADPYLSLKLPTNTLKDTPKALIFQADARLASFSEVFPQATHDADTVEEAVARLIEDDLMADAALLYSDWTRTKKTSIGKAWQIYWDEGRGFNEKQKRTFTPTLQEDYSFYLKTKIPATAKRIRIDPPSKLSLKLLEPTITIEQGSTSKKFDLWKERLALKGVKKVGNYLASPAIDDPYFSWTLPNETRGRGKANTLLFRANVPRESFSTTILRHLESPARVRDVIDELKARGKTFAAKALEDAWSSQHGIEPGNTTGSIS